MKQRITKANLLRMAENCNREVPQVGWKFNIEYAYGRALSWKMSGFAAVMSLPDCLLASWRNGSGLS